VESELVQGVEDRAVKRGHADLLQHIRSRETALHAPDVRRMRDRLDALLHDDFVELGRSGRTYTKSDILDLLPASPDTPIVADRFVLRLLDADTAMLTYRSASLPGDGSLTGSTLRLSIWRRSDARGWQILFHQGRPAP
jgi:hypothetical protein